MEPKVSGPPAVELRGLVKRYDTVTAVDGVDLVVNQGEVYGYLGPNGAGKTTSMRMILGLIRPDEGTVRVFGRDPFDDIVAGLQGVAGFVETTRFYPYLSGRKNLEFFAALDGGDARDRIDEALDLVELTDRAKDRTAGYSFGMKQRLGIAAALVRDPRLLILDEPTTGLDPAGQRDMRTLIRRLADRGLTVLLSSHHLGEVEELCSRVAIIRSGHVVYEADIDDLARTAGSAFIVRTADNDRAAAICRARADVLDVAGGESGELVVRCSESAIEAVTISLGEQGIGIRSLAARGASLEDLFFELTAYPSGISNDRSGAR
jgi:ABC-2 type transport system ATP-binding protein